MEFDDALMQRAYAVLNVKELKEDERVIRGIATTPTPDRIGDIIEPLGVNFKNPMPFLWQHQSDKPIGLVNFDKATRSGIKFEARIPKVTEPGLLKDRVDEAWQSLKYGLVAGASIGFRPLKDGYEKMEDGGIKFKSVEVMELSAVTIPANQDCTISLVKSLDQKSRSAETKVIIRSNTETKSVSTDSSRVRQPRTLISGFRNAKTLAEQITALENTRAAKAARMEEVIAKGYR
jgi:HK97 family phage prohead protease